MSDRNREQQQQKQGPLGPQQSEKSTQDLQKPSETQKERGAEERSAKDDGDVPDADGLSDANVERIREKGF